VEIERALDLAARLLEPESTKRLTPRSALFHPFLAPADGENDDDAYFPHPFGEGVCGSLHFRDEVTDDPCVRVRVRRGGKWVQEVRTLLAGEGIAVGNMPCEFHHKEFGSGTE
jgi:cell division control protein 7